MSQQHEEFTVEKAQRSALPVIIGLYGMSGCGKTLSGLKLARGLVGPNGKIGVIDTENRRAQLYAGRPEIGEYDCITLNEPFAPERFTGAVRTLERMGCGVIMVDSLSAEWEGPGGVLDMADAEKARTKSEGLHVWNKPKMRHKGMVQRLIRSPAHIICCLRGKEEVIQKGKSVTRGDVIPIQERDFIYEMTMHMRLNLDGNLPTLTKCMGELKPYIDTNKPISVEAGERIAEWVNKGVAVDAALQALILSATDAAQGGRESLKAYVATLSDAERAKLRPYQSEMNNAAKSADEVAATAPDGDGEPDEDRAARAADAFKSGADAPEPDAPATDGPPERSEMWHKGYRAFGIGAECDEYPNRDDNPEGESDWQDGWKTAEQESLT